MFVFVSGIIFAVALIAIYSIYAHAKLLHGYDFAWYTARNATIGSVLMGLAVAAIHHTPLFMLAELIVVAAFAIFHLVRIGRATAKDE